MHIEHSLGELSILHSLRDGDDPILRAPASELLFFERDVARLAAQGFIQRRGRALALTPEGMAELSRPENASPVPFDPYTQPAYLHRMFGVGQPAWSTATAETPS